jgi:hypothetical protein
MIRMLGTYKFSGHKVILRIRDRVCETSDELLSSDLFREILNKFISVLESQDSPLLEVIDHRTSPSLRENVLDELVRVFLLLSKMPLAWAAKLEDNKPSSFRNPHLLYGFIERLYDFWRDYERYIVCDSEGDILDQRPYRTFNTTIESLTHLVRGVYREVQENISGQHPNIYRQIASGAEIATIALPKEFPHQDGLYARLSGIPVIRQVLMYPPLLLNPPMNKRTGNFMRIDSNPLNMVDINNREWLCYPAMVGQLLILVYFHEKFFELGFALSNLFELADDIHLKKKANAIFLFGVDEHALDSLASLPTVFYEDRPNDLLVGSIPRRDEFGYFGYLKKMILTLHNIIMIQRGRLPYHGAMFRLLLRNNKDINILIIGDTGAGKSETLEAFRKLGKEKIRDLMIIADDMGSLEMYNDQTILGFGTETGAFVRLDDLQPGYAFGQLDRSIIMNPNQSNSRVVLPVTSYENITRGYPVGMLLYANNYQQVDSDHPIMERFENASEALSVFREGTAMSKGTTTSTGLVHTYFTNIFGPIQYREQHDAIANRYFESFFASGTYVGQLRTRLGIEGWERKGPEEAARTLLEYFS